MSSVSSAGWTRAGSMATDALQILSLAEGKRELDIPDDATDRDARVTNTIQAAVRHVSELSGVPLLEEVRTYRMEVLNSKWALIDMPLGWPKPIDVPSIVYRLTADGGFRNNERRDGPAIDPFVSTYIQKDPALQQWMVDAELFTGSWTEGDQRYEPVFKVRVGVLVNEPRFFAYKGAVSVTLRALYANDPIPAETVMALVNAGMSQY